MVLSGVRRGWLLTGFVGLMILAGIVYLLQPMPPENLPPVQPSPMRGEFLTWKEVDQIFPRNAYANVVDFETGLTFRVQRRAGTYHADVQPLTADDTAIMKRIYNGQWAWKRRAVLVRLDNGRVVAASMNGMPHGSGAIQGNKFNGHFCIHFRDSITHGSRSRDTAHQMMIWKAAGVLDEQLAQLNAEQIVDVAMAALAQGDAGIVSEITCGDEKGQLLQGMASIAWVNKQSLTPVDARHYTAIVQIIKRDSTKTRSRQLNIEIVEAQPHLCITAASWLPLLEKP